MWVKLFRTIHAVGKMAAGGPLVITDTDNRFLSPSYEKPQANRVNRGKAFTEQYGATD